MSSKSLLYIITKPPYSSNTGAEALDAILVGSALETEESESQISVLFLHDGVFQIIGGQKVGPEQKQHSKAFAALADFGIENIYVYERSLTSRGIQATELMCDVEVMDMEKISQLIRQNDRVLTF